MKHSLGEWKNTETREMDDCWTLEGQGHVLKVRLIGSFLQVFGCMGISLVQARELDLTRVRVC